MRSNLNIEPRRKPSLCTIPLSSIETLMPTNLTPTQGIIDAEPFFKFLKFKSTV